MTTNSKQQQPVLALLSLLLLLLLLPAIASAAWGPAFQSQCPTLKCKAANSSVEVSWSRGKICCPSCANYTTSPCPAACVNQNLTDNPCFAKCGDAGCRRAKCGEPKMNGGDCCPALNCPNESKIYLGADCCPMCHKGQGANPGNPSHCKYNVTKGVGQAKCDQLTGQCKLVTVPAGRDSPSFNVSMLKKVCSSTELTILKPLMDYYMAKTRSMMQTTTTRTTTTTTTAIPTPASLLNLARDNLMKHNRSLAALRQLPMMLRRITSPKCRSPLDCYVPCVGKNLMMIDRIFQQVGPKLAGTITNPLEITRAIKTLTDGLSNITKINMANCGSCMAKLNTENDCVMKLKKLNVFETLRDFTTCNITSEMEFGKIKRFIDNVTMKLNVNMKPDSSVFKHFNCSDLAGNCILQFISAFMKRAATVCMDATMKDSSMEKLRMMMMQCKRKASNFSDEELFSAASSCLLTASDIKDIAPNKLKNLIQNNSLVEFKGMNKTRGGLLQDRMQNDCPLVKQEMDKLLATNISYNDITAVQLIQLFSSLPAQILARLPRALWSSLTATQCEEINSKLMYDSGREPKCKTVLRHLPFDMAKYKKLKSCVKFMKPDVVTRAFSGSPADKKIAAAAYNTSEMRPKDIASSKSTLRDLLSSVTADENNCLEYMNSLFSFKKEKIADSLCLNDTCFKMMAKRLPGHSNTKHCQSKRPKVNDVAALVALGGDAIPQLPVNEFEAALGSRLNSSAAASIITNLVTTAPDEVQQGETRLARRMRKKKRQSQRRAVMNKVNVTELSVSDADPSLLSQLSERQLKNLDCSQMVTFASRASSYLAQADRGSCRRVVQCVCQQSSDCKNISAEDAQQIGAYSAVLNSTEFNNLPKAALAAVCKQLMSLDATVLATMMDNRTLAVAGTRCKTVVDLSGLGGSNVTAVDGLSALNSTVVQTLPLGGLSIADVRKCDADALMLIIAKMAYLPVLQDFVRTVCERYFELTKSLTGNYSISSLAPCAKHLSSANQTKIDPDDLMLNGGAVMDFLKAVGAACDERRSRGLASDCANVDENGLIQQFVDKSLQSARSGGARRRRKRATTYTLTCQQVQNFGNGLGSLTTTDFDALSEAEFQSCFSAFGLANVAWSSAQCAKIKTKTELLYNSTMYWNSAALLTANCMTQCWTAAEIANIPYSEIAHISDIGQYCTNMPAAAKQSIVSAYISKAKANDAATMTRTEISSLGHLACGATTAHVGSFNHTHVLNSLTELGSAGPCDSSLMTAYIARVKVSLGSSVATWAASYFASITNLLGGLSNAEIAVLTEAQISNIDAAAITQLPGAKLAAFSVAQLTAFSSSQKSAVTAAQLASLSNEQKTALTGTAYTAAAGTLTQNWLLVLACTAMLTGAQLGW